MRPRGRPCGAPRVAEQRGDIRYLIEESSPLFKRVLSLYLFRVGLCSHTILFCTTRGGERIVRFRLNGGDRVDPSPHDHDQSTCVKTPLSGCNRSAYLTPRGDARSVGSSSKGEAAWSRFNCPFSWKLHRTVQRCCGRTSRSSRDRGVIEPRSRRDRTPFEAESLLHDPTLIGEDLRPGSKPDRDPIVARSWSESWS